MTLPRLFLTFELPPAAHERVAAAHAVTRAPPGFALRAPGDAAGLAGCEAVMVSATQDRLDAQVLAALPPSVRAIATYSVGHDHIDLDAARARGIAVFSTPDVLSASVAEVAMLLLLGAARRVTESVELLRSGQWRGWSPTQLNGVSLQGRVLGIAGMGRIGREVAQRARGFGMRVHYHNRTRLEAGLEQAAGATWQPGFDALFAVSQCLVLACPATPQTVGLVNARTIGQMPAGAIVVNIGRGTLVVDDDLIASLRGGRVAAAGLDVFDGEPRVHPGYFELPNVFMLPHIGSSTVEARTAMAQLLVDGMAAWRRSERPVNQLV